MTRKFLVSSLLAVLVSAICPASLRAGFTFLTSVSYPGASNTVVQGVQGNKLVGWHYNLQARQQAFLYDGTTYSDLTVSATSISSYAHGISGNYVVGSANLDTGYHGFLFDGTGYTILNPPNAKIGTNVLNQGTHAEGISGNNVVGYYFDSSKVAHGYTYNILTGVYTTIDEPKATNGTWVTGIDGNNVVGYYIDHGNTRGFLYDGSTFTTLNQLGFGEGISGVNVVGNSGSPNAVGQLFSAVYNTSTQAYTNVSNYQLWGISGNRVVGAYWTQTGVLQGQGYYTGFIAAIPEPSSLLLTVVGGMALLLVAYRHMRRGKVAQMPSSVRSNQSQ